MIDLDKCYSQYDEKCPLILSNNISLYAIEDGWRIKLPEGYLLNNEMISNFKLQVRKIYWGQFHRNTFLDYLKTLLEIS